jgi:hypothetical protein
MSSLMRASSVYIRVLETFGASGSQEVRSILGRLYSGTAFLFLLDCTNIGIWFMSKKTGTFQ